MLFATLLANPKPTKDADVGLTGQEEGQSFPKMQEASAPESKAPIDPFPELLLILKAFWRFCPPNLSLPGHLSNHYHQRKFVS